MHAPVAVEENRLLRSIPAARVALIERIARAASGSGGRNELPQRFLRAYFHGVADEDLAERTPRQLAKAALAHLAFAARRAPGRSLVRVFNPDAHRNGFESAHTLVLTVTDDMPFLVDSLGMAFSRAELAVHLIVHPVLQVRRDRRGHLLDIGTNGAQAAHPESWQLYEIDRVSDPAQLDRLQRDLEATLADVRFAVNDWTATRERVREIITRLETDPPPLPAAEVSEASHLLDWMEGRHFVFLGYRRYRLERGRSEDRLVPDPRSGLGILSSARRQGRRPSVTTLRGDVRARAREPELLIVTKAKSTATSSTSASTRAATTARRCSTCWRPIRAMSSFRPGSRISSPSCAGWSTCTSAARCACWCGATPITASTPAWCMCRATATTPRCASASSRSRAPASPAPASRATRRSPARATRACTSWCAPTRTSAIIPTRSEEHT